MARQLVEALVDDLDGSKAAETVSFQLDGKAYKIDLNEKHAAALRKALARFIEAAQSAGRSSRAKPSSGASRRSGRGYDVAQLREWAAANKIKIPARGRIPQAVVDQFVSGKK
jgi:hypothetical protein